MDFKKELRRILSISIFIVGAIANFGKTTSSPQLIPCEEGSYFFGEKCYKMFGEEDRLTWKQASDFCKTRNGSLVTIHTQEFQDFLTAYFILGKRLNPWIGLHDRQREAVFMWDDGSVVNYTNWEPAEPSSGRFYVSEDCAEIHLKPYGIRGEWRDVDCDQSKPFICQSNKNEEVSSHDSRFCTVEKGGGFKYFNSCYQVVLEEKSWEDAEAYCQQNLNGHLLTIFVPSEEMFLYHVLSEFSKDFWIGIKIEDPAQLKWSSGWPVVYRNWNGERRVHVKGTCTLKSKEDFWDSVSCSEKRPFICETSEQPFVIKNGLEGWRCPHQSNNWIDLGGDKCYIFRDGYVNWDTANYFCVGKGGTLAVIESEEETNALSHYVIEERDRMFIGLRRKNENEDVYEWVDGTPYDYENWHPVEPHGKGRNKCVEVWIEGMKWNDAFCGDANPYICSVKKIPPIVIEKKGTDVGDFSCVEHFNCSVPPIIIKEKETDMSQFSCREHCSVIANLTKTVSSSQLIPCGEGSYLFGEMCYKIFGEEYGRTWKQASDFCKTRAGSLVTITTQELQEFLTKFVILDTNSSVWIGLHDRNQESVYMWDDGSVVNYTNWEPYEPTGRFNSVEDCVEIHMKPSRIMGMWRDVECDHKRPFICQLHKNKPFVVKEGWKCPNVSNDWIDLGGDKCFIFEENNRLPWYQANDVCGKKGGSLAVIESEEENNALNNYIIQKPDRMLIGLRRNDTHEDLFEWVDGTAMNYQNWYPGEPNDKSETCGEIWIRQMQWNDVSCDEVHEYICSAKKIPPTVMKDKETQGEDLSYKERCNCAGYESLHTLFMVLVGISIVSLLVGLVIFNFKRYYAKNTKHFTLKDVDVSASYRNAEDSSELIRNPEIF